MFGKKNSYDDRDTAELIWTDFTHQTARPVEDATPDPHLHSHCFVFNVTWDETEKQFKAGQFRDINRDMPYYQAMFHKRLSDRMMSLGYQIRQTDTSFEIEGVPQKVVDLFSKRTDEIGRAAKKQGITDAKRKSELGAKTRSKKQKGLSMDELKTGWRDQIRSIKIDEAEITKPVRYAKDKIPAPLKDSAADLCVSHALKHCFERFSVMPDRRILAAAFRHSLGKVGATLGNIADRFSGNASILHIQDKGRKVCTTRDYPE